MITFTYSTGVSSVDSPLKKTQTLSFTVRAEAQRITDGPHVCVHGFKCFFPVYSLVTELCVRKVLRTNSCVLQSNRSTEPEQKIQNKIRKPHEKEFMWLKKNYFTKWHLFKKNRNTILRFLNYETIHFLYKMKIKSIWTPLWL